MKPIDCMEKLKVPGARILLSCAVGLAVLCAPLPVCKSSGATGSNSKTSTDGKSGTADTGGKESGDRTGAKTGATTETKSDAKTGGTEADSGITAEMRQNGFVSASSYQVFVTAFGSSESEARESGLAEGRRKALNLMRTDPALRGRTLSAESAEELRRVVQNSSRIVRLQQEPNGGSWSVVILVEKEGLKAFIRRLR